MAGWRALLEGFVGGDTPAAAFHDAFFRLWREQFQGGDPPPDAIGTLFYVVEAFCPDPALRNPGDPTEADEAELHAAARVALAALAG